MRIDPKKGVHRGDTLVSKIRATIEAMLPGQEFSIQDFAVQFSDKKTTDMSNSFKWLLQRGEIEYVGKTHAKHGGLMNLYRKPVDKPIIKKVDRKKKEILVPIVTKARNTDIWQNIWPDLYQVPKHLLKYNRSENSYVHVLKEDE